MFELYIMDAIVCARCVYVLNRLFRILSIQFDSTTTYQMREEKNETKTTQKTAQKITHTHNTRMCIYVRKTQRHRANVG